MMKVRLNKEKSNMEGSDSWVIRKEKFPLPPFLSGEGLTSLIDL